MQLQFTLTDESTQLIESGYCQCGCGQKTNLAPQSDTRKGIIKGQPMRFVIGHGTRRPLAERFWEKVDKRGPDECWLWTGAKDRGYGKIGSDSTAGKIARNTTAYRVSWELHNGPIPDGLNVCHNCPGGDNPSCVNPAHLFLGTQKDNVDDMVKKGRAKGKVQIGTDNRKAKLTPSDVLHIRDLAADGVPSAHIARMYGMNDTSIGDVVNRNTWKHVK